MKTVGASAETDIDVNQNKDEKMFNHIRFGEQNETNEISANFVEVVGFEVQVLLVNGAQFIILSDSFINSHSSDEGVERHPCGNASSASGDAMKALFGVWIPVIIRDYTVEVFSGYWS